MIANFKQRATLLFQDLKKGIERDRKVTNFINDIGTLEVHEQSVHERERKFYYIYK